VPVVPPRRKTAANHLAPGVPHEWLAQQLKTNRVRIAHHTLPIDYDNATWQQVENALQSLRETLFLLQLLSSELAGLGKLPLELGDAYLQ